MSSHTDIAVVLRALLLGRPLPTTLLVIQVLKAAASLAMAILELMGLHLLVLPARVSLGTIPRATAVRLVSQATIGDLEKIPGPAA